MNLDRNTNQDGTGKYALIHMRKLTPECKQALIETKRQAVNCGIVLPTKAISLGTGEDTQLDRKSVV